MFIQGGEMKPWVLSRLSEPAKGLPEPDALNCVVCPNGCMLRYAEDGTVTGAKVYSDAMDWLLAEAVEEALTGCTFRLGDMQKALKEKIADPAIAKDLCELLEKQSI
jgi:hypothetical protein